MKNLFKTFKKSIYNPSFYQNITNQPLADGFWYYIKATAALTAIMTVSLSIIFIPMGVSFIKDHAPNLVKTYYPENLVVGLNNGEASTNVSMPYFVPMRTATGATTTVGSFQNMLVIDTTREFDKNTFESYKTLALLTKTDVVTGNERGQITIQTLRGVPSITVSQQLLLSWIQTIRQSLASVVIFGIIATFVIIIAGYLIYLLPLLLFALIPLLVAWVKKSPLSYGAAYRMSLYAIVPALVIKTALNLVGLFFLPSYLTLLIFMLIIALNMRDAEQPKLFKA